MKSTDQCDKQKKNVKTTLTRRVLLLLFFQSLLALPQNNLEDIDLRYGPYEVGFRHYTLQDSTRTYQIKNEFNNSFIPRPIPVSIWFPADRNNNDTESLKVLDYLNILKTEEEWTHLPNEFLLDWFSYLWNTEHNKAQLSKHTKALKNGQVVNRKFPVIVYAPSYQASSIENFALCEYLASHGHMVISSPSRGTDTRQLDGGTTRDMETQSTDIAFLLKEIQKHQSADFDKTALMGFSFGGLSNFITAIKNKNIKAVVSLDGTERYNYPVLEGSPFFNLKKFTIPYIHFAQKEIPKAVLETDGIPQEVNHKFQLMDSLTYSEVHSYRFHDLTHSYFSTFGLLFTNRDKRQDKDDSKIARSYKLLCEHTLHFLDAIFKKDANAIRFIENSPIDNGYTKSLVSKRFKMAITKAFDYLDFNDLAKGQNYRDLVPLYQNLMRQHPQLKLEEGMLNTLGLRLSFDPERMDQGINVFKLALHIYPNSANLYDSLAEAYLYKKDFKNAMTNFKKSLELNPANENAKKRIGQIKKQ
ncbi:alpha/beta hydrolase [uncultured Croceitalea sp.]|uniref:alpha/beta hydrolase n=1 Tax=uncultured Croceitalea sp. TaxID=1798908 RepID=UPI003305ACCF